jgi:GNAT superfamily N-acetyltransferase
MVIREATLGDLHGVVMLILGMKQETPWKAVAFVPNYDHVQAKVLSYLQQPQHRCWVADDRGILAGMCGVEILTHRFVPDVPYMQEWALTVRPEYRGTGLANRLWRTATEWGARMGAMGRVRGTPTAHGERTTFDFWGKETPCLSS